VPREDRSRLESELLRDFRRAYHHYSQHIPAPDAIIEWISLMQHHGAPTRLLDCTYSIYVAAYFALESADSDCAVWAINAPWALRESVAELITAGKTSAKTLQAPTSEAHEHACRELFFEEPFAKVAVPVSPFRQNERLRTQRATFLVPGDVRTGFMDNLLALRGHDQVDHVAKIVFPRLLRATALEQLYSMNISRRSLFPGLDGYAQSLGVFHPAFRPVVW
jgi:FRG domain-containing protein